MKVKELIALLASCDDLEQEVFTWNNSDHEYYKVKGIKKDINVGLIQGWYADPQVLGKHAKFEAMMKGTIIG